MKNKNKMYERALTIGQYVVDKKATVRQTAAEFNISKSTVHNYLTKVLPQTNGALYLFGVEPVIMQNKAERHIRGGEATKRKYLKMK
ncbi:MAG: sporulation transcriptional regulator SpoIIID [Bacilli bacterium]|nr:sporulation transcriptional regulator SpoIIID [Bacilli bacterium]